LVNPSCISTATPDLTIRGAMCGIWFGIWRAWSRLCANVGHEAEQAEIEVADPRYAGTNPDLNPRDPFGHRIVFWLPLKEA